ncbi:MAG: excisionase family DNA-binding protein [Candidatus Omnitrophica bacterium]|nr:excisionase family DNA-binding protein [Candidatus Omnitrophota bacterium]
MKNKADYITIPELAKLLGMSRIAVFKKVKKGEIEAVRIGKTYAIPRKFYNQLIGKSLGSNDKKTIDSAVKKAITEYGETIKLLGKE